jgi:hypothetical protein
MVIRTRKSSRVEFCSAITRSSCLPRNSKVTRSSLMPRNHACDQPPASARGFQGFDHKSLRTRFYARNRRSSPPSKWATAEGAGSLQPHSMTSSVRARIAGGTVRPSALAVFRLTTSSNVVGCWIGRSAGAAPLRILSTYSAASRNMAG